MCRLYGFSYDLLSPFVMHANNVHLIVVFGSKWYTMAIQKIAIILSQIHIMTCVARMFTLSYKLEVQRRVKRK